MYSMAFIFKKTIPMRSYYMGRYAKTGVKPSEKLLASTKEVTLLCRVGWGADHRPFANIKCPVNPLPVTGNFCIPSVEVLTRWLCEAGWTLVARVPLCP